MLYRWLLGISIISLSVGLLLLAFVSRKPICIDSQVVKKIDRSDSDEAVYACEYHRHISYDEKAISLVEQVEKNIVPVSNYLQWLAPFERKITLSVRQDRPFHFAIEEDEISIGSSLVNTSHLERALIKAWLNQQNPNISLNSVGAESLIDLIQFSIRARFEIFDPTIGKDANLLFRFDRTRLVKTGRGYCESPWKRSEDLELCITNINELEISKRKDSFYLRPLLSQSLIESYEKSFADEKVNLIRNVVRRIENLLSRGSNVNQSLERLQVELSAIYPDFSERFEEGLRKHALDSSSRSISLDLLVLTEDVDLQKQIEDSMEALSVQFPSKSIGTYFEGAVRVQPHLESVNVKEDYHLKVRQIVYFSCGHPSREKMAWFSEIGQRLLLINPCGQNVSEIRWDSFIRRGITGFSLQNQNTRYVSIHLPSYDLAYRRYGARRDVLNLNDYQKASTYDSNINALRPLTEISVVDAMRVL